MKSRAFICALAIIALALAGQTARAAAVTSVSVSDQPDRVEVRAVVDGPVRAWCNQSAAGKWVTLDIQAGYQAKPVRQVVKKPGILAVKAGWFSNRPPATRVSVSTVSKVPYELVRKSKEELLLVVWKSKELKAASARPKVVPADQAYAHSTAATKVTPPSARMIAAEEPVSCTEPAEGAGSRMTQASSEAIVKERPLAVWRPKTPLPAAREKVAGMEEVLKQDTAPQPKPVRVASTGMGGFAMSDNVVSLNFVGTDINDVLKALTLQANRNIVTATDVKGEVTVSLQNVKFEDALDSITKLSGYKWINDGNTYYVATNKSISSFRSEGNGSTELVAFNRAAAKDLQALVMAQYPGLSVTVAGNVKDARSLVLSGPAEDVSAAKTLIAQIDSSMSPQRGESVVDIYKIRYASAASLTRVLAALIPSVAASQGALPSDIGAAPAAATNNDSSGTPPANASGGGLGQTGAPANDEGESRMLILYGAPEDIARARDILAKVDVPSPQVLIEAKVVDLRKSNSSDLGIRYDWSSNGYSFGIINPVNSLDAMSQPVGVEPHMRTLPLRITALLDAEIVKGNARLLASPKISALEGRPASIFIGDQVKYVQSIQQTTSGTNVTTDTINVGVELRCVAQVSEDDDRITLMIHPEASVISEFLEIAAAGVTLPQVSRRFADSTIRVKNGDTIVIGGLIRENEIETMRKIPLLADLPFFGQLFRHRSTTSEKSEIVIFITSSILKDT